MLCMEEIEPTDRGALCRSDEGLDGSDPVGDGVGGSPVHADRGGDGGGSSCHAGSPDGGPPAEGLPALLEVQSLDTELQQLRHRKASLPQRGDLEEAATDRDALRRLVEDAGKQIADLRVRQRRYETEAEAAAADADAKHDRLYSGDVSAARGLRALKTEVERLRSLHSELEDRAIEALLEIDDQADKAKSLDLELASLEERVTVLEAELRAASSALDARLAAVSEAREEAAGAVDADVLAAYERRRPSFGHCTVVSFDEAAGCDCPDRMPIAEVARVRNLAPSTVLDCSECGRMVLR